MASFAENIAKRAQEREQEQSMAQQEKQEMENKAREEKVTSGIQKIDQDIVELTTAKEDLPRLYTTARESAKKLHAKYKELEGLLNDEKTGTVLKEEMGITKVAEMFGEDEMLHENTQVHEEALEKAQDYIARRDEILEKLSAQLNEKQGLSESDKEIMSSLVNAKVENIVSVIDAQIREKQKTREALWIQTSEGKQEMKEKLSAELITNHGSPDQLINRLNSVEKPSHLRERIVDQDDIQLSQKIEDGDLFVRTTLHELYKDQITKVFERKKKNSGVEEALVELNSLPDYKKDKADLVRTWEETKKECKATFDSIKNIISGSKELEDEVREYYAMNSGGRLGGSVERLSSEVLNHKSYLQIGDDRFLDKKISLENYLDELVKQKEIYNLNARDMITRNGEFEDIARVTKIVSELRDWIVDFRTKAQDDPNVLVSYKYEGNEFEAIRNMGQYGTIPSREVSARLRETVTKQGSLEGAKKTLESETHAFDTERDHVIEQMRFQVDADWDSQAERMYNNAHPIASIKNQEEKIKKDTMEAEKILETIDHVAKSLGDVGNMEGRFAWDDNGGLMDKSTVREGDISVSYRTAVNKHADSGSTIRELEDEIKKVSVKPKGLFGLNAKKIEKELEDLKVQKSQYEQIQKTMELLKDKFDLLEKRFKPFVRAWCALRGPGGLGFDSTPHQLLLEIRSHMQEIKNTHLEPQEEKILQTAEKLKLRADTSEDKFKQFLEKRPKG